jgi:hypothetical protein
MRNEISYKSCLIRAESFQREKSGKWIAQYNILKRQNSVTGFPSQQYQLNEIFATEDEADDFAVRRAREWIDQN